MHLMNIKPSWDSLASGFPNLLLYLVVVSIIFVIGLTVYVKLTPHKEIDLVQHGNTAAAISFSGVIIGLSLPLAACMVLRISLIDVAMWGSISVLLQLLLFRITDLVLSGLPKRIEEGEVAAATVLSAFKLAGSLVLAFAIAG